MPLSLRHRCAGLAAASVAVATVVAVAAPASASPPASAIRQADVAPAGSWITDRAGGVGRISFFNPSANAIVADPLTGLLFTADGGDDTVTVLRPGADLVATIPVGVEPLGIGLDLVTHRVYVANAGDGTVSVIDQKKLVVVDTIPAAVGINDVDVDALTHTVYVSSPSTLSVLAIRPRTHATTSVAIGATPTSVAVDQLTRRVYTTNGDLGFPGVDASTVSVIDGRKKAVVATIELNNFPVDPRTIAIDPLAHRGYVASRSGPILAINLRDNSIVGRIAGGESPSTIAVDPLNHTLYSVDASGSNVRVYAPGGVRRLASIHIDRAIWAITADLRTHRLHVLNAEDTGGTTAVQTVGRAQAPRLSGRLASGTVGALYHEEIMVDGFPYVRSVQVPPGQLPDGLGLSEFPPAVDGFPTVAGRFAFTVTADNGVSPAASRRFVVRIR